MKNLKLIITYIFVLSIVLGNRAYAYDLKGKVHELKLKNGMRWLLVERHQAPVFSGIVMVRVGGADEEQGKTGLAHMFEHMAFKGSSKLGTSDFSKEKPILDQIELTGEEITKQKLQADADKKKFMVEHSIQVKTHIKQLSQKSYWEQFKNTPEFVVMFIPSESLFSAALEQDPSLIEFGANERVILATPTTLIALLRAVAYGWRQESIHESVQDVINLGQELYKRFNTVSQYFSKIGRHLNQSVDSYNQTLASFENRLIPVMRRFQDIKALKTDTAPEPFKPIDAHSKSPQSMEFLQNEE